MASQMPYALDVQGLACERGGRLLFEHLSFRVGAGEALGIEGANGAGKTTLLRAIAGLLPPARGTIRIRTDDRETADGEERGKFVALLGHRDAIKGQLTAGENASFHARIHGAEGAVDAALDAAGIAALADMPAGYLSAGQKRRLAVALLILSERPVWLLDEPFAALDSHGRAMVARLTREHCAQGGIVIAATHEPLGIGGGRVRLVERI